MHEGKIAAAAIALMCSSVNAWAASRQEIYNQAQAAFDRRDWAQAVKGFREALSGSPLSGRSSGMIRSRLATALVNSGETADAHVYAKEAVAVLAVSAPAQDVELASALLTLGDASRYDLAYAEAIRAYADALAHAPPSGADDFRRQAAMGTILSASVIDPDLAARTADALIANRAYFDPLPKPSQALVFAMRARIELNRQNPKAALPFIRHALSLSGTLTDKVTLTDVTIRGDAALVYQLLGDDENTRLYLAYTGAGHLDSIDWLTGEKDLPVCGADVRPDDTAVVEFAIGDDGRTSGAAPIYVSRPGEMGLIFAEAVRAWRWDTEAIAKLEPFWRASMRLQLRCVTRPPGSGLGKPFAEAVAAWLRARGEDASAGLRDEDVIRNIRGTPELAELNEAIKSTLAATTLSTWAARLDATDAILVRMNAPVEMRALTANTAASSNRSSSLRDGAGIRADRLSVALSKVDAMPGGVRAAAWLRTERAIALETAGRFDEARPMLVAVEGTSVATLPEDDPIRKVAILHLSLLDRRAGDNAGADARITRAGVTANQCELFDVHPVPANVAIASSQFPAEALRWHFEGYVREAFDIAADGSVTQVRTVVAYPPFVFAAATEKAVSRFRYIPPKLGNTVLGCANQMQNVRYTLPH